MRPCWDYTRCGLVLNIILRFISRLLLIVWPEHDKLGLLGTDVHLLTLLLCLNKYADRLFRCPHHFEVHFFVVHGKLKRLEESVEERG